MDEFIEFVDNMNIVCTEFAPLQILDVVGSFVGMVPYLSLIHISEPTRRS